MRQLPAIPRETGGREWALCHFSWQERQLIRMVLELGKEDCLNPLPGSGCMRASSLKPGVLTRDLLEYRAGAIS
jgi:hypothetical protein